MLSYVYVICKPPAKELCHSWMGNFQDNLRRIFYDIKRIKESYRGKKRTESYC